MEQIWGTSSWKLNYTKYEDHIRLNAAVTRDRDAALPEELFGLPVTILGQGMMKPFDWASADPSECIELISSPEGPDDKWNNRNIRSLVLPAGILRVEHYALMNCDHLERLELTDRDIDWGTSPMMNCDMLHQITLHQWRPESRTLCYLCRELPQELDITMMQTELGREACKARLLFPEYSEIFNEHYSAHKIEYSIEGLGYPYHHVFRDRLFHFQDYDRLWEKYRSRSAEELTPAVLAWFRLRWPRELSDEHREAYRAYTAPRAGMLMDWIMEHGTASDLHDLLSGIQPNQDALRQACDTARQMERTDCLAILLEKLHGEVPRGRAKSYSL